MVKHHSTSSTALQQYQNNPQNISQSIYPNQGGQYFPHHVPYQQQHPLYRSSQPALPCYNPQKPKNNKLDRALVGAFNTQDQIRAELATRKAYPSVKPPASQALALQYPTYQKNQERPQFQDYSNDLKIDLEKV